MQEIPLKGGNLKKDIAELPDQQLQQILRQANQWADYQRHTATMHQIAYEMKENPETTSNEVKDSSPLQKVEFPEEGGVLTFMENFEFPYRGYPHYEFVDKIDSIKKTSRAFVSGLYHQLKDKNRLWFVTLIPSLWIMKDLVRAAVYVNYRLISRFKIKPLRYSRFCREIYRVMSIATPGEKYPDFREQIRDTLCMLLEMDNAYRFRFQDLMGEMSKEALKSDSVREILRLLDILQSRESVQEVKDTWKLARYVVSLYLKRDKKLQKIISHAFSQVDLEKVKLDAWDKIFCIPRKDYTFGFEENPSPEDLKLIQKNSLKEKLSEEKGKIRQESTKEHEQCETKEQLAELDKKYEQLLKDAQEIYRHELELL